MLVVLLLYAHWQAPTTHKSAMPPHVRLAIHALAPGAWEGRGAVGRGKRDGGGGRGQVRGREEGSRRTGKGARTCIEADEVQLPLRDGHVDTATLRTWGRAAVGAPGSCSP